MRRIAFASSVALLTLVTACSTSSEPVDSTTAAPKEPTAGAQVAEPTAAAEPTKAAEPTAAPSGSAAPAADAAVLTGELGANDAFTITLKDAKGAEVTSLKAGTYQIKIKDTSKIHNYHLSGPGVDVTTTIPEVKDVTWPVTLKAGTFTFECDPHPNMKKTFTVT
jgi:plastocyanin